MNQYEVINTKSEYFGLTCHELEVYHSKTHNETWIKVALDFVSFGGFKEVNVWFNINELTLIN